ncbi:MAG TPA: ATP-binding cassette domain-containing protein, partial [Flavisolibacter sp.]|nr:ATP-binding cassette domain-containing protein [Flavisolibacter sp.]
SVFPKLSVEDNIRAVLEMTHLSKREQKEKLEALIREFRLEHVRKSHGDVVSGGERRRTEIARALAVDPKFILLDEPFAGIDPIAVEDIQAVVARLKYKNIGILITDHNVTETLSICDRAYLLIEGKIFKHGTAEELAEDDQVKKLYLGRNFELKRKDWLLDDAGRKKTPDIHSVIQSIENGVEWFNQIEDGEKELGRSIGSRSTGSEDQVQKNDYVQYIEELKPSLWAFIEENPDEELRSKMNQLESAETFEEVVHDLNTILFLLKSKA